MKIAIIVLAVLLAGCNATMPQSTAQKDPSATCYSAMDADPSYAPLSKRLGGFDRPRSVSIDMRSSKDMPTAEERELLRRWYDARQTCHSAGAAYRMQNSPAFFRVALDKHHDQYLGLIAKLYAGEINYGEFIAGREYITNEVTAAVQSGSQQAQALESQRRAANAAETARTLQIMQALQPPPQRLNTINCTTQRLGTVINTQCN